MMDVARPYAGFEAKILTAFVVAAVVVTGVVASTWKVAQDAADAAQSVAHTHDVLDSLVRTKAETLQIEFSTQSFRISGDPARLAERDASIAERETLLNRVKQLVSDNARQMARWAQLREVINQRLAISRRVELLRKSQGQDAATAFVATAPLQQTRERTYGLLREMDAAERALLQTRIAEELQANQSMAIADVCVAALFFVLLGAGYVVIRRQLRENDASRRALADSEESLSITLNSIGDAVLATDTMGRVTRINPVAERLTGWSLSEARGRPIDEVFCIVNEMTRAPAEVPVAKVLATGMTQGLANHTVVIARDGTECPIADSAAPIRDTAGRIGGVVLVFRDVSLEQEVQRSVREANRLLEQKVQERTSQLHESEEHLRGVISNVPALIAYVDAQQRYVYVNEQYRQRFAPERADISGSTVRDILGEQRYAIAAPFIEKALQGWPQSYDWEPVPGVWQAIDYVPKRDTQERVIGYYVLGRDITERKHSEEKIEALNTELEQRVNELQQVSRALKTLSAGNRTMLRAIDEQDLLDNMCRAIVEVGGYHMASVWYCVEDDYKSLQPMAENNHPGGMDALRVMKGSWADNEYGRGAVATAIRTGHSHRVRNILIDPSYAPWRAHLPGCACALACPLRVDGEIIGGLAIYATEPDAFGSNEVTLLTESADDLAFGITTLRARADQEKIKQAVYRLTRFDGLTGLPNETQFTELLTSSIETGQRLHQPFAILQTNIERLSEINDALGFSHGDQMLQEFGTRIRAATPASAIVARLRGDEFAILMPDTDTRGALAMVRHLDSALVPPFHMADISLDMSAKTGVVVFPDHGATPHDLYRHMDIAVHLAKKKALGCVVFDPSKNRDQSRRLGMAGELRRAIEGGDLSLYLQPKVDMVTGRVCGAEGLVRWNHATRGLIMPGEFIGLAEHTGLIKPLTEWVIATSLRLNHDWRLTGATCPIAVNLSARNLRDEGLLETILHLQATWGVAAGLLELEITESTVMEDAEFALRVLHGLREASIPLYIDDFGTGYSSLSYLQKLPVDYIKIDQSFVRDMAINSDSSVIVRSTIDLAHDLGRRVVAEGVETQQNWDQLAAFGCDFAQGYFIARPMPASEFPAWVEQFEAASGKV